jgi:hypothetical protein
LESGFGYHRLFKLVLHSEHHEVIEMLENVKIGKKLIGGFILTIIIMLIIAGTGFIFYQ